MNNELIEQVPNIVKAIWDYYGKPCYEHYLLNIPKTIEATVAPGITCRMLTDAIDRYIEQYPQEAIKHGLVVWFGELLCYKNSRKMDIEHEIWVSCIGRAYQKQDDGSFIELPHELMCHGSNVYWRYAFPWNKEPLQDIPEYKIDMNSLAPHRIVCYYPGLPMPKLWSKLFDARRNGIPPEMIKSGGDYYIVKYGQPQGVVKMTVEKTERGNVYPRDNTGDIIRHIGDHVFNDTAQEPGVYLWFTCRLVLPDINRLNNHSSTNNDRDCLSWPMPQPAGFAQQIQYDPWQYVQYTQYATHNPYRFDRVGDRAIRYYQQMIRQYYDAINNGCCSPVNIDEYDWCEAMK
ncbi:hypothetical protein HCI68_00025, partial [Escherichia coli]|nr:hypothetical protein [Escherichia coli]MBI1009703.1 hypothetical protein [Escherichia coli]MBI1033409.1 hypothetical protein [Escherichia coli]MBI1098925.1 hypothetical protein [Escherichia coli]